jgi:hypothetical protein
MAEHTPGPWEQFGGNGSYYDVVGNSRPCDTKQLASLARQAGLDECATASTRVCRVHKQTEGEANLGLILAAPDLLQALRRLLSCADHTGNDWDKACEMGWDAIAKADGREFPI